MVLPPCQDWLIAWLTEMVVLASHHGVMKLSHKIAIGIAAVVALGAGAATLVVILQSDSPDTAVAEGSSPNAGSAPEGQLRVAALMDQAGCDGSVVETQLYSYETGHCTLGGSDVTIAVFRTDSQRDEWISVGGEFGGTVVSGSGWAAISEHPDPAGTLAESLSGTVQ
ncbi:hypothetical protein [Salinispora tropica]|uniref:hypothetical protein n=1 Tax=Salinispora tropica TaxID=168695 RepID=UPI0011D0ECD4|nr:hypothetical protein [Salinispora tropica]